MPNLIDKMFSIPEVDTSSMFDPAVPKGSGSDEMDTYIAQRVALLMPAKDVSGQDMSYSNRFGLSYDEVVNKDREALPDYIREQVSSVGELARRNIVEKYTQLYGQTGDPMYLDKAAQDVEEATPKQDTSLREALPQAVVEMLDKAGDSKIKREIIRRDMLMNEVASFMQEHGMLESLGDKVSSFAGLLIPFRNTFQYQKKGKSANPLKGLGQYKKEVSEFQGKPVEEQIVRFRKVLEEVYKEAGKNPLIFIERSFPYINKNDMNAVNISLGFDALDLTLAAPSILKFAKFLKGYKTPVKLAANLGDKNSAARMVNEVLDDATGEAEKAVGIDKIDAAGTASPFGGQGMSPGITDGLAAETQSILVKALEAVRKPLKTLLYDGNFFINRSPLTQQEITTAQQKYLTQFAGTSKIVESGPTGFRVRVAIEKPGAASEDVSIVTDQVSLKEQEIAALHERIGDLRSADAEGFTWGKEVKGLEKDLAKANTDLVKLNKQLDKLNNNVPATLLEYKDVKYTYDDVGGLDATEYSRASQLVNSAKIYIDQIMKGATSKSTVIQFEQQKLANALEQSARKAFFNIPKKSREKINSILIQGDTDKVNRYSSMDLFHGVKTDIGLVKLDTVEEMTAYHAYRDMADSLYALKNRELRRQLEFGDYKSIRIPKDGQEVSVFVKPDGNKKYVDSDIKSIYDLSSKRVIDIGSHSIVNKRIDNEGLILMKAKYPIEDGDNFVNYVLGKATDVKGLPDRVLAYRPGYVPRMYKNVFFVGERVRPGVLIDGVKPLRGNEFREPARYFDSKEEAITWGKLMSDKGELVEVRPGKEWLDLRPGKKEEYEAAIFGGLYSGKSNDAVIPFGLAGTEAERISAFEALESYIGHVSNKLPMNEFRMGMIRRFLNSATDEKSGASVLENPGDWKSRINLPNSDERKAGLEATQKWLMDQFRIMSSEERGWAYTTSKIGNLLEGRRLGSKDLTTSARRFFYNLGNKDITAEMRGLAFHSMLGWFNFSQLLVQGMGATVAFSLHPEKAPKLIPQAMALRFAMNSDMPEAWAKAAIASGVNVEDFKELVRAYRKTGLGDSIRSTADYSGAIHGLNVTRKSLQEAADKGLIFFREGELFNRNYGWLLARDEFLKGRKGYKLTDADIDNITERSLDFTLNLNRANRAAWQKGWLSIPTQFMQITAKFIENITYSAEKGGWSKWEKTKVLAGQAALYGAAGVPAGNWLVNNFLNWAKSEEDYGLAIKDPETIAKLQGGLVQWGMMAATGENVAISKRVSLAQGVTDLVDLFLSSDRTLYDKISGAFGQVPDRVFQAADALAPLMNTNPTEEWDKETLKAVAGQVGSIISTFRNARKAKIFYEQEALIDARGRIIERLNPEDDFIAIGMQAAGFQPQAVEDAYGLRDYVSGNKKDISDAVDAWFKIAETFRVEPDKQSERYKKMINHMVSSVMLGLTEEQRHKVADGIKERLKKDDYAEMKKLLSETIDTLYEREGDSSSGTLGTGGIELNSLMAPKEE